MEQLHIFRPDLLSDSALPYADEGVWAGFPSPAQDYMENAIDLNRDLVNHPESTFYARVMGDSMVDAGVKQGDILIVDKALEPRSGDMAVCIVNGEFTVKYLDLQPDCVRLIPANERFEPIEISDADSFEVWGVVTYVISSRHRS